MYTAESKLYTADQIVATAKVPHPAPGATDEARALFRLVDYYGKASWWLVCSKGPYVDKMSSYSYPRKRDAVAALHRPHTQGMNFKTGVPNVYPLRPCSCESDGSWKCPEHRTANV